MPSDTLSPVLPAVRTRPSRVIDTDIDVEVLVDDDWRWGILRQWSLYPEPIGWIGWVTWNRAPGNNHAGQFPADRIRPSAG